MTRALPRFIAAAATVLALGAAPVQAQDLFAASTVATPVLFPVAPLTLAPAATAAELPAAAAGQQPSFGRESFEGRGRRPSLLPMLYASQVALQALDAHSTYQAIGRGAHEANPLMKGVVGNKGAMLAVKAGVAASTIFLAERMWKRGNRVGAIATMLVVNGVTAAVVANNYRVASGLR